MNTWDLRRLPLREELASLLRGYLSHLSPDDVALSPIRGGRQAALAALARVRPESYARTRNHLDGDVTQLSAYLRHGVLTLAEVRDSILLQVTRPDQASKLVSELAWRDYWQRLYTQLSEGIWDDRESYKTGYQALDYVTKLPEDIPQAATTLTCMDSFARQLRQTGYLHNHARMWFAAYLVHWRRVRWQEGARWFLEHLVDGDPASNNLSWQWVASTFASKPYIFNRDNLERYTAGVYCRQCPHASAHTCPFDHDYEGLEQTLFPLLHASSETLPAPPGPFAPSRERGDAAIISTGKPLLWVHTDALNPESPMLTAPPESAAVFVWDVEGMLESKMKLKRVVFVAECLAEMPDRVELRRGDLATELLAAVQENGADYIVAQRTPDPRLQSAARAAARKVPVVWYDPPPFVEGTRAFDLKRFSRYWQRAQHSAMQVTRQRGA